MKFAAHTSQSTLRRDYLSSITVVDGLASFLKLPLRSDQAEDFRSMTVRRNPNLLLSLPAKEAEELQQRSDWVAIEMKLRDLSQQIDRAADMAAKKTLQLERKQLMERKRFLENEELRRLRRNQDRIHPEKHQTSFHRDQHRSKFNRIRHMLPERDALSRSLFCVAPIRSDVGVQTLKCLVTLLKDHDRVAYQPSLRPQGSHCQGLNCKIPLEEYVLYILCKSSANVP